MHKSGGREGPKERERILSRLYTPGGDHDLSQNQAPLKIVNIF